MIDSGATIKLKVLLRHASAFSVSTAGAANVKAIMKGVAAAFTIKVSIKLG